MNSSSGKNIVIRPFSSKRGIMSLFFCSLIGLFFAAIIVFINIIAPAGDATARSMMVVMGIVSGATIILGIILFLIFPRVTITFDSSRNETIIKSSKSADTIIHFGSLQPFQIYEVLRGYAHQYYCRNASFGDFSDLFFSANHGRTLKKAQKLAAFTGATLIDYDGKVIG